MWIGFHCKKILCILHLIVVPCSVDRNVDETMMTNSRLWCHLCPSHVLCTRIPSCIDLQAKNQWWYPWSYKRTFFVPYPACIGVWIWLFISALFRRWTSKSLSVCLSSPLICPSVHLNSCQIDHLSLKLQLQTLWIQRQSWWGVKEDWTSSVQSSTTSTFFSLMQDLIRSSACFFVDSYLLHNQKDYWESQHL